MEHLDELVHHLVGWTPHSFEEGAISACHWALISSLDIASTASASEVDVSKYPKEFHQGRMNSE